LLIDGHGLENDLQTGKRDFFTNQHEHPQHPQDLHLQRLRDAQGWLLGRVSQAGAPMVRLVFVHATGLHRSEKQYLVPVTLFGPMMKLDDGNLLVVQVLETTN
jgi:hypothetical protein